MSKTKVKDSSAESRKNAENAEPVSHNMCNEMTDAQREAIVYHSKLLNKYYESYDDMLREEAEFKRQNEEKQKLTDEKKTRAKEVEAAYLAYQEVKEKAFKEISEAEKKWIELRDAFAEKYGGYHMTYVNKNGKKSITFSDALESLIRW